MRQSLALLIVPAMIAGCIVSGPTQWTGKVKVDVPDEYTVPGRNTPIEHVGTLADPETRRTPRPTPTPRRVIHSDGSTCDPCAPSTYNELDCLCAKGYVYARCKNIRWEPEIE